MGPVHPRCRRFKLREFVGYTKTRACSKTPRRPAGTVGTVPLSSIISLSVMSSLGTGVFAFLVDSWEDMCASQRDVFIAHDRHLFVETCCCIQRSKTTVEAEEKEPKKKLGIGHNFVFLQLF